MPVRRRGGGNSRKNIRLIKDVELYIIKYLTLRTAWPILLVEMANSQPLRKERAETDEPVTLSDRAIDNLQYIRETMERSTHFTAVPGYGGMLMGVTAVAAAYIAQQQPFLREWLIVWLAEAALAFAIGLLAMWQKSKIAGQSLVSAPARKFAFGFAPPLIAGVAITLGLLRFGHFESMAPTWMIGAFSVRIVPVMGWLFIAAGAVAFVLPAGYGNIMMGASFGLLHIAFGAVIARRYGG